MLVVGLGPVGLCGLVVAKAMGGRVIGVEPIAERRALARDLGADEVIDAGEADVLQSEIVAFIAITVAASPSCVSRGAAPVRRDKQAVVLRALKPDEPVEIVVKRDDEEMKLTITPGVRK